MSDEEFKNWFIENLSIMQEMNIYHYNTERAKDIKHILSITAPRIKELEDRVASIEKKLNTNNKEG